MRICQFRVGVEGRSDDVGIGASAACRNYEAAHAT